MGHWTIAIHGHGIHHNSRPDDAEVMAKKFVNELRLAGHDVGSATFTLTNTPESIETYDLPETPGLVAPAGVAAESTGS